MKNRVIITGATGLVGSHLAVELLARGTFEVHCTTRSAKSVEKLERVCKYFGADFTALTIHNINIESSDEILELLKCVSPSVVFHTAATVSLDGRDTRAMIRGNVDLAEALTDALYRYAEKPALVHVSSIAAIGAAKERGEEIDESCEIDHIHSLEPYSLSKFLSENVVWRGARMGTPTIVVNPSVVLGTSGSESGSDGLQSAINIMRRGIPFYTSGVMGFVDVRDVARAMVELSEKIDEAKGGRYILSGVNANYKELISIFAEGFGVRRPWFLAPKWLLRFGIWCSTVGCRVVGRRSKLTPSMVGFMTSQSRYSSEKLLSVLPDFKYHTLTQSVEMIALRTKFK